LRHPPTAIGTIGGAARPGLFVRLDMHPNSLFMLTVVALIGTVSRCAHTISDARIAASDLAIFIRLAWSLAS
jgi:hypothetical protein